MSELRRGSRLRINNYEFEVQAELNPQQPGIFFLFRSILNKNQLTTNILFVIDAVTVIDEAENTERQPLAAELVGIVATGGNRNNRRGLIRHEFISPLFGRDNPLDFVLDEVFVS